jgi:beta-galactosidase
MIQRIAKLMLVALLLSPLLRAAQPDFQVNLQFSLDGGGTWLEKLPVLEKPGKVLLRVDWQITGETREILSNVITTNLFSADTDFASAVTGKQYWNNKKPAYYQRLKKYWFSFQKDHSCSYPLDFGARPAGTTGIGNKWDKIKRRFVNGPLPACPALTPGTYDFTVNLRYRTKDTKELVEKNASFAVSVKGDPIAKKTMKQSRKKNLKETLTAELPKLEGDYVFGVDSCRVLEGKGELQRQDGLIRTSSSQEVGWPVAGIKEGRYYVRALIQSGSRTGEEELGKYEPYLFLNGKTILFNHATPLVTHNKMFLAVIQSSEPLALKNGDELRWNRERSIRIGGVALANDPLPVTPLWVKECRDPDADDFFRLDGTLTKRESGKAHFSFSLKNILPQPETFHVQCRILDYFQNELVRFEKDVSLANRREFRHELDVALARTDRCRAVLTVRDSQGHSRELVQDLFVDDLQSFRRKIWLNTDWQWQSIEDDGTLNTRILGSPQEQATGDDWQKADLPYSWKPHNGSRNNHHLCWFRKRFTLPRDLGAERLFITFSRISVEGRIFLNGHEIGGNFGWNAVQKIDVTDVVRRNGENELLVGIRDKIATLEPAELKKERLDLSSSGKFLSPSGIRIGLGEVWLSTAGRTPIQEVFVKPSFRRKKLDVQVTLPILKKGENYRLQNTVYHLGEKMLAFENRQIRGTGLQDVVELSQAWKNPILWGPEKFPLLQLVTELHDARGRLVDRLDTRFGFREFWPEGTSLLWNGVPVKFGSRAFFSTWSWDLNRHSKRPYIRQQIRSVMRNGCRMLRHIYDPPSFAETADEEGLVFASGLGGISGPTKQKLESDAFWNNARRFAEDMILAQRNHPSIVTWYLSNEFYAASQKPNRERLQELGRAAQKLDDTRILEFGCDLELGGFSPVISTHYPVDLKALREPQPYFPEAAYWRRFSQTFKPGMQVPAGMITRVANVFEKSPITWGHKPIVINETCWISFFHEPDGLSRLFSDRIYESPIAVDAAHNLASTWFSRGHRDTGASCITLWQYITTNPNSISLPRRDINLLQQYHSFYAGETVTYDVNLTRDLFNEADVTFAWRLEQRDRAVKSGEKRFHFQSCELKRTRLELTAPNVNEMTEFMLVAELQEAGRVTKRVERAITVYPTSQKPLTSPLRLAVLDETGDSWATLQGLLAGATRLTDLSTSVLTNFDVVIIGENQTPARLESSAELLNEFVKQGGTVIMLQQSNGIAWLPVPLEVSQRIAAINFTFRPAHPLLKGVKKSELSYWYPEHKVASNCYLKPTSANCRVVVEAGGPDGMVYAGLLELPSGQGRFILSQLEILHHLERNPVARKLWRNLLDYSREKPQPLRTAGFKGLQAGAIRATLQRLGVQFEDVGSPTDYARFQTIILDAQVTLLPAELAGLTSFVRNGGNLLIHGLQDQNLKSLQALCGSIQLTPVASSGWQGRGIRLGDDSLTAGLTNYDLFWKKRPESENYRPCFLSSSTTLDTLGSQEISGPRVEPLLFPAFLARVRLGQGSILLDTLNLETTKPGAKRHAGSVTSLLLTNLGVRLEGAKRLTVPKNLSYQPVDISSLLNRAFADAKDNDGQGGWTDQGPKADLSDFPLDKPVQVFNGVPFRIEQPKSCLVLSSKYRHSGAPQNVEIPFGGKADVLFFLQSSAWTNKKHHASYVVHYADGKEYEIKLVGGINLRDWASDRPDDIFSQETDTITRVAWTGKSKQFGKASLFMLAWPNPYPAKTVERITYQGRNIAVTVLVAVTAGHKAAVVARQPSSASNLTQARKLTEKARTEIRAGRRPEAVRLLKEAVKTAWDYPDSYVSLGYVYEDAKDWRAAVQTYDALAQARPLHFEAYYRLGKCWEKLGDYPKAVESYERSLQVNFNQPETISARNDARSKIR